MELLERNPLAKLDLVSARGREVRPARAFTDDELRALFALDGERALFYRALFYTGARVGDLKRLVWEDVSLREDGLSVALIRASTTKTRVPRVVPLHPCLIGELRRLKNGETEARGLVFKCVPTLKELLRDLKSLGIERRDSAGRVVHRHALRMTARTVAVRCGVSERICDAVLGHSNANRMGTRYTDISGLPLHEWTKLPWFGRVQHEDAQLRALNGSENVDIHALVSEFAERVQRVFQSKISEEKSVSEPLPEKWSSIGFLNSNLSESNESRRGRVHSRWVACAGDLGLSSANGIISP